MKKVLLLIFIGFCSFIFYQMVLGENGLIEGFRIKQEKERLLFYRSLLEKQKTEQANYIKYLQTNPKAYKELAEQLGFFNDDVELIKIINKVKENSMDINHTEFEKSQKIEKLVKNFELSNSSEKQIKDVRLVVSILFYIFFGFFAVMIFMGGQRNE
jgi:hypothetical protein